MADAAILMVDDDPINIKLFRALLGTEDYDLVAADSGREAVEIVTANPKFDLVLLDVSMPDLDGIEVCRRLKEDPRTRHIPIVLVSAYRTDDQSVREGLRVGADGYLTKPIDDVILRAWVKATLRISQLQRELARQNANGGCDDTALLKRFAELSHEVNNPLQAIYAGAELLGLDLSHEPKSRELLNQIRAGAEKVAALVARASIAAKDRIKQLGNP